MKNVYTSASEFFGQVGSEERVYFLVRHGERGHILPDDPHHGAFVGLTETGREQALNLGKTIGSAICKVPEHSRGAEVCFFSSPVGRCMETAQCIGRGIYESTHKIPELRTNKVPEHSRGAEVRFGELSDLPAVTPCQPLAEFFVEHYDAYMETHKTGFYQGICRWLDGTAADPNYIDLAYFPLAKRSQEMLDMMLEKGRSRINIFCSHDAWIVPCLAHFCGLKFTPQLWMNFLTGIAFVVRDVPANDETAVKIAGGETAATAPHIDRIVAVTGLADGNLFF